MPVMNGKASVIAHSIRKKNNAGLAQGPSTSHIVDAIRAKMAPVEPVDELKAFDIEPEAEDDFLLEDEPEVVSPEAKRKDRLKAIMSGL